MCARRSVLGLLAFGLLLRASPAAAQACCAGSGAVTPVRLGLHDQATFGAQLRASNVYGSHDADGEYVPAPAGAREWEFGEDIFAAVRVLGRGQLGALVPFVQTHRRAGGREETGGGLGDLNLSARYDFLLARESLLVPGVGLLAGVTLPTGQAVESAEKPLATDATGLGAAQINGGVAVEQIFGAWLFGVSGIVAYRPAREVGDVAMELAPQWSLLGAGAYVFESGASVALSMLYTVEGDATVDGRSAAQSSRRGLRGSVAASIPVDDSWSLLGSLFADPPVSSVGVNQTTLVGASFGAKWALL